MQADQQIGINLKRVIEKLGYKSLQAAYRTDSGFTLDWLYKRARGQHSLKLRDILMLAEFFKVDPGWLAGELLAAASDQKGAIAELAEQYNLAETEMERRFYLFLSQNPGFTWRSAYELIRAHQVKF